MEEIETTGQLLHKLTALKQQAQQTENELAALRQTLYTETVRRERLQNELAALEALTTIASTAQSEDELIERATQFIGQNFYTDNFGVLFTDRENNQLRPHHSYQGAGATVPSDQGIARHVVHTGQAWNAPVVTREATHLSADPDIKSALCVPLKVGTRVIGVLNAESKRARAFDTDDKRLLTIFAGQLAIGIEKMRLVSETANANRREQQLTEISRVIDMAQDFPTILANVIRMTAELIGADAGTIGLIIDNQIITCYPYNVPRAINLQPSSKGQGTAWYVVESGRSILLDNYLQHPRARRSWVKAGVRAFIGVSLTSGETVLGTLELFCLRPDIRFNQRDLSLVEAIGRQAGAAIHNMRLYADARERAGALAAALARQEEMDAMKTQFVENVSHELRTPLGIVLGYAELLENENLGQMSPSQQQAVQIIAGRARMLNNLIDDLSALLAAETQDLRHEDINLAALITALTQEFQVQAQEAGILLFAEIKKPLPQVEGHPIHLYRVFDNLIANAFKYTPVGGMITLRLQYDKEDVIVDVADTGAGIPEEKLARIFERFYKVDTPEARGKKGTGLGLALVKEIVEAHRGTVSVRSQVEVGTTFRIRLPGKRRS